MSDAREDKAEVGGSEPPAPMPAPEQNGLATAAELSGPGVNVRFAGRSSVGLVREHNEDNLVIANLTSGEIATRDTVQNDTVGEGGLLFAVCDGMGGAAAGEVASQMAVDILHEALRRTGPPRERDELARRLVAAVEEAGKRIFEAAQKERSRRGMGTTATVAVLIDKVLFIAEVGDSRAYLLRGGVLKQLTKDQSLVNQLIEAGHLTEAEAEAFEHSNIILQALGTSETVQVDLTFVELRRGDRLMLCSDGLSGLVHVDTLRDTLASVADPSECTAMLTKYAEGGGGHDNITVLVVDFGGDGLPPLRDTDSFGYLQYPLLPVSGAKSVYSDDEVTEATSARNSGPPSVARQDEVATQSGGGASSVLWVSFGIIALLGGAWILAVSGSNGSAAVHTSPAEPQVAPVDNRPAEKPEPPTEAKPVTVRVFSDVQDAVLLVNGEPHGALTVGQAASMELKPGAYRFEAQTNGNIAAFEVATVRPDVPLEVNLKLPSGHESGGDKEAAKPDEAEAKHEVEKAEKPEQETASAEAKPTPEEDKAAAAAKRAARIARRTKNLPDLNAMPPAAAAGGTVEPPPAAA
ncbi:MAG TPA: PP2C family serine/threonine-protein phosphatase, partial [Polyangiales bacterium]|nr:PP2C family serine/threonine-protein phosphatase [Polyangiales bacterium]